MPRSKPSPSSAATASRVPTRQLDARDRAPTSVSSRKSAATAGAAAIVKCARAKCRRTAAIAGSASTASPSQFGGRTTDARTSSGVAARVIRASRVSSGAAAGNMPRHRGSRRTGVVAPAPVHPEPEMRMAAHVHLEHVACTAASDLAHGIGRRRPAAARPGARRPGDSGRRASGSANAGMSGAPVRSASVASADVVAAGRSKKSTFTASAPWMC